MSEMDSIKDKLFLVSFMFVCFRGEKTWQQSDVTIIFSGRLRDHIGKPEIKLKIRLATCKANALPTGLLLWAPEIIFITKILYS